MQKLRSIPPVTALGRQSNVIAHKFRMIGLGIGSGQPRISNELSHDKWVIAEHKPATIKRKPKIVIRPESSSISIEVHDNGGHYLLLSVSGKPTGIGISNLIASLTPVPHMAQQILNNGIWSCKIAKEIN